MTCCRTISASDGQKMPAGNAFRPEQRVEIGHRDAPGIADRRVAAGQGQVFEVRGARQAVVAADEPLAAPNRAIVAVAGAIERDADHRSAVARVAVIRQTRGDVRAVMLHPPRSGQAVLARVRLGEARGQIVRVQIADHGFRLDAEQVLVRRQRRFVVLQRFQVLHIADVLADEGIGVAGEGERVLEQRPGGEDLRQRKRQLDGERRVAPRAAEEL